MLNKQKLRKFLEGCKDLRSDEWWTLELNKLFILEVYKDEDNLINLDIVERTYHDCVDTEYAEALDEETIKRIINWVGGKK
ncbi:MAG: hypothetical protein RR054_04440 [Clostridia bacterium]